MARAILYSFIGIYAFGVALVLPWTATPGNEPSWQAALGQAVHQHLIFGRDVVFTYGPLGYLAVNAALPASYAAKIIAAIIIAAIVSSLVVFRSVAEGKPWQRVVFAVGSVLIVAIVVQVTTIDILLFFALVLALTPPSLAQKRPNRYLVLALGLFAGAAGLVKFSYCVGSLLAGIAAFAALADTDAVAIYIIGFCLGSAGVYACVTFGFWPWIVPLVVGIAAGTLRRRLGSLALVVAATSAAVPAVFTPYARFFIESWREASEYSAGMAADGSARDLIAGLFIVAVVIGLAIWERAALGLARILVIVLMLGLAFKEGFVRQDTGHLVVFLLAAGLLAAVVLLAARLRYTAAIALLVVAFTIFASVRLLEGVAQSNVLARTFPSSVAQNIGGALSTVLNWHSRELAFDNGYRAALAPDSLPPSVVAQLRPYPIDLVGSETNVIFANGLQWKPEPVFQPRNAYAPALDLIDRASLQTPAARRELVAYTSVDNRYPLSDQPFTYDELLCRRVLVPGITQPVTTSSGNDAFVALQPSAQRCSNERIADAGSVAFGEPITVAAPHGNITFLIADFHYTLLGLLFKTFYHVPPINMNVDYGDGDNASLRIIPAVARDGMLIDPVPKDVRSLRSLLAGNPVDRVRAVTFSAEVPACFIDDIGYRVTTVKYAKPPG
ncbi:MAG TPA: hypothetical protein VGG89_11415 [Candidatus Baltobacteraceae bacterium]|jgi:hypothetical protein